MTKDVLDEILEAPGKSGIMLKFLIENGLSRKELLKALFDQSGMERIKAESYHEHYKPIRAELKKQIGFLSAIIDNPAPDWMNNHKENDHLEGLEKLREDYKKKQNELYPKKHIPKGPTWKTAIRRKIINIFNIIIPVFEKIKKTPGRSRLYYTMGDVKTLIKHLWDFTYGNAAYGDKLSETAIKSYIKNYKKPNKK